MLLVRGKGAGDEVRAEPLLVGCGGGGEVDASDLVSVETGQAVHAAAVAMVTESSSKLATAFSPCAFMMLAGLIQPMPPKTIILFSR